jgi:hypothetical protein
MRSLVNGGAGFVGYADQVPGVRLSDPTAPEAAADLAILDQR